MLATLSLCMLLAPWLCGLSLQSCRSQCCCCTPDQRSLCAVHATPACATAGLPTAQKQLEVAGRTVVWLLHAANQELLAANQLDLRGVMTVQGWLTAEERKVWKREVDVSCPGLKATMRLDMVSY